ncbi:GNAT family N-acetyltransferase [Brachybacterium sp. AOP25-B2-12]|uniref:GNAT family N-acetyltransferase n=1 Tax=Brachybacterium sp. AOP25-B2-12 TaxID=3457710 RepID=UPI004034C1EC
MTTSHPVDHSPDTRTPSVRVARPEEYEEVGELTLRCFTRTGPQAVPIRPERRRLLLGAELRAAEGELLVVEDPGTGRIVGTVSLLRAGSALCRQATGDEREVRLLGVDASQRGRGLAAVIMRDAIARVGRDGGRTLVLDTGPLNTTAHRLYERLGFVRHPEREDTPATLGGFLRVYTVDVTQHA